MKDIRYIENTDYSVKEEDGRYFICDGEKPVLSPGGKPVSTQYEELADKLLESLAEDGYTMNNPGSLLSWHFDLLDKFIEMDTKQMLYTIMAGIMNSSERDWTFKCPYMDEAAIREWEDTFGTAKEMEDRMQIVADWLNACTRMQITAASNISRAFGSFNVAYILAFALEHGNASPEAIAKVIVKYRPGTVYEDVLKKFDMFSVYYGLHIDENEKITDPLPGTSELSDEKANEIINGFLNNMNPK